ncbi:MAG: tRNA uridine-5-carboxymethylaminomethyl(34) synthesis GTPase MnmE [Acidobacteria bacterium]|nr:tRNA uridine-5-carboxymethylaminomethyl(34) synthesis GTPase MnmE [Acidobacteriota bacterium]
MSAHTDTIVALSTPPGRGGIGVVRISGPRATAIALEMFRAAAPIENGRPEPGRLLFGQFVSAAGEPLDHGYLATFRPPRSFTGEETAELWAHGSPAITRLLVQEAIALGARPATPGEFTLRAFLNGRIDVTQAEAIRDLIEARTAFQAKVAHDQVLGRISKEVDRLKDRLADVMARLEASLEFSEEGEAGLFLPEGGVLGEVRAARGEIEALATTYVRGRLLRDGARVAIVGSPNAGKSSLFNKLLDEDRAIVTPIPGTTRDVLEETLDLDGVPVTLIDTAGLHAPRDEADAEAVRRAREAMRTADLLLLVLDRSRPMQEEERTLLPSIAGSRCVVALNKSDLDCGIGADQALELRERAGALEVSAKSGDGIEGLRRRLGVEVGSEGIASREGAVVTNARHRDLLVKSAAALARAEQAAADGVGEECLLLDLKEALDRLGEITGEVGIEGIYERIFKNFCIGK